MTIPFLRKTKAKLQHRLKDALTPPFAYEVKPTEGARISSDISDHLPVLQFMVNAAKPKTILELGTRDGQSTRIFCEYVQAKGATGFSCDLSAAPEFLEKHVSWTHFEMDDLELASLLKEEQKWPNGSNFKGLDFCFIDTSHEYQHTVDEIEAFWPLGNPGAFFVFHDTNMSSSTNRRIDGSLNTGWDNKRGVVRAIEEYFYLSLKENSLFVLQRPNEKINSLLHFPWCNGMTLIQKV